MSSSCLNHVSTEVRVDSRYLNSQLPDPNGPLARASALSVANRTAKFIQQKLCRELSSKFKFCEIKALYSIVSYVHVNSVLLQFIFGPLLEVLNETSIYGR